MQFVTMIFSHPSNVPFPSELALKLVTHFTDAQLHTVLDALKKDRSGEHTNNTSTSEEIRFIYSPPLFHTHSLSLFPLLFSWVVATKSNENQTGRSFKFSAGWLELLRPQCVIGEVFQMNREFIQPWPKLVQTKLLAPTASGSYRNNNAITTPESHQFSLSKNARGGEVAAIFQLHDAGQLELFPHWPGSSGMKNGSSPDLNADELMVDVESIPQVQTWIEVESVQDGEITTSVPPPPVWKSYTLDEAKEAASSAAAPLSHQFIMTTFDRPFSYLMRADAPICREGEMAGMDLSLSEDFLLPSGPVPTSDDGNDDVEMMDTSSDVVAPTSSTSTASSSHDLSWLDHSDVTSAQVKIESIVQAAGVDGIDYSTLRAKFYASIGLHPMSTSSDLFALIPSPLQADSTLFRKSLARALQYLSVIKVPSGQEIQPRYIHSKVRRGN